MSTVIYVLKLEGGKYYVGETNNINRRFEEHLNGNGSIWTAQHPPLEIVETAARNSMFDEDNKVKAMMLEHGIDNVRGGTYSMSILPAHVKQVLQMEFTHNKGGCFSCGEVGHFVRDCPQRGGRGTTLISKTQPVRNHAQAAPCAIA